MIGPEMLEIAGRETYYSIEQYMHLCYTLFVDAEVSFPGGVKTT